MLCYVMLCYVMLCYVMLCYVILSDKACDKRSYTLLTTACPNLMLQETTRQNCTNFESGHHFSSSEIQIKVDQIILYIIMA